MSNPTYAARKAAGLCIDCAGPRETTKLCCNRCLGKRAEKKSSLQVYHVRREAGLCGGCGEAIDASRAGKTLCSKCAEVTSKNNLAYRERKGAAQGNLRQCRYCNQPPWFESKSCRYHFVEKITHNFGMPKEHVEAMAKKLEDSNFTCAYSGIPLIPGDNASIDHAFSVAARSDRISDPNNLVWCDRVINAMKAALDIPDFAERCAMVGARKASVIAMHAAIAASPIVAPASVARVVSRKAPRKSGGTRVPIMLVEEDTEGILPSTPLPLCPPPIRIPEP